MNAAQRHWLESALTGIAVASALAWALGRPPQLAPLRLEVGSLAGAVSAPGLPAEDPPVPPATKSPPVPDDAKKPAAKTPSKDATPPDQPAAKQEPVQRATPPAPDASRYGFPIEDKPGGHVSLFAVLVDHRGAVIDVQLPVPSRHQLDDVAMAMALYVKPIKLDPPLDEGKTVWLPIRFEYRPASEHVLP